MKKRRLAILSLSGILTLGVSLVAMTSCRPDVTTQTYTITSGSTEGATLQFSKTSASEGETISVVVVTPAGKEVDTITAEGVSEFTPGATSGTYTFKMPAQNVVINVTLKDEVILTAHAMSSAANNPVTLTFSVDGETVTRALAGDLVTVDISEIPEGKMVDTITATGGITLTKVKDTQYTFTMIDEEVVITVTIKDIPLPTHALNVNAPEGVTVVFNQDLTLKEAEEGTEIAFLIFDVPEGKEIDTVTVDGIDSEDLTAADDRPQWEFTMPAGDITVNVTLKDIPAGDATYHTVTVNASEGLTYHISTYSPKYIDPQTGTPQRLAIYPEVPEGDEMEEVTYQFENDSYESTIYNYGSAVYFVEFSKDEDITINLTLRSELLNQEYDVTVAEGSTGYIQFADGATTLKAKPETTVTFTVVNIPEGQRVRYLSDTYYNINSSSITEVEGQENTYQFVMPIGPVNLSVTFETIPVTHTLTIQNNTEYSIELIDYSSWEYLPVTGETIELNAGVTYQVSTDGQVALTLDGEPIEGNTFIMPNADATLVIDAIPSYALTVDTSNFTGGTYYMTTNWGMTEITSGDEVQAGSSINLDVSSTTVPEGQYAEVLLNGEKLTYTNTGSYGGETYWSYSFTMPSEATTLTIRWSEEIIQSSWSIDYNGFSGSPYLYSKAYYEGIFEAEIPLMLNSLINEGTELCLYVESLEITQISINGGEAINPVAADGWGNYFNITMPGEDMVIKYNPSVSSAYTLTYEPGESGLDATFHIMDDYGGFGEAVTEADAGDQIYFSIDPVALEAAGYTLLLNGEPLELNMDFGVYIFTMPSENVTITLQAA